MSSPRFWFVYEDAQPLDFWTWALTPETYWERHCRGGQAALAASEQLHSGLLAIASRTTWDGSGLVRIGAVADWGAVLMHPIVLVSCERQMFAASRLQLPWADGYCGRTRALSRPLPLAVAQRLSAVDAIGRQTTELPAAR